MHYCSSRARRRGRRTSSEVIGATPEGVLLTADGVKHEADLVIGADGVRSRVRGSLGLLQERNAHSEGIIRVLASNETGAWQRKLGPCHRFLNLQRARCEFYVPCNKPRCYLAMMAPIFNRGPRLSRWLVIIFDRSVPAARTGHKKRKH